MKQSIALGADHGGFDLKNSLVLQLQKEYQVLDLGAHTFNTSDDYPDFSLPVARAVASGQVQRGIIICGSGVGACITANKVPGVRAGICHDTYSAHQGVEHDDMNVLCLGARIISPDLAIELVRAFLNASFSDETRHRRRLQKVLAIERQAMKATKPDHEG